ncbi:MAG: acyl-CoA dehydrogenase family protein [Chloroflexota bacterium]
MQEHLLTDEHRMFRDAFRKFAEREIVPHQEQWEKDGIVSREVWRKAGEAGFLCMDVPEEYGGLGVKDYRYHVIVSEELARVGEAGVGFAIHTDMIVPYITNFGSEAQKARWLPGLVSGDLIASVAMSEPNTGSDLQGVQTTAVKSPDGSYYTVNGQKTFISNGILNDVAVVVAKTDPDQGARGISLIVLERGMEGYERGRNLDKIGMHAQDTAELFFKDVKVPAENLIGQEGHGFYYLMQGLPQERLAIAVGAIAQAEVALAQTIQYCQERTAFGRPIGTFQNSRFKLAEMKTEVEIGRVFADQCVMLHNEGKLTVDKAAMAKWWLTELQWRVIDQCLQLHGGYGYMMEYPIAKHFINARAQRIYGGTNEIMKEIIGRSLGF